MSSLVPGQIFVSTGLNRNSTPTPPDTTPAQLERRYRRIDFNGHDWPCDSPVSRAYDVANTSTKLIILNNKYGKKGTRLRGYYTGPKKPERHVDPNRHRAESPRNPRFHSTCLDSSSPKFEPTIKTDLEWINSSQRPPNALIGALLSLSDDHCSELDLPVSIGQTDGKIDTVSVNLSSVFDMPLERPPIKPRKKLPIHKGTPSSMPIFETRHSVNPSRHASCMATPELPVEDMRSRSRMSLPPNRYFTNSEYSDMSIGEKIYLWSIEKIYNMDKMKQLKQEQYRKLLDMEAKKGYHGYREYSKYMRYINSAKDRSYGTGTPSDKRSRSACSPRSQRSKSATSRTSPSKAERSEDQESEKENKQERPKTSLGHSRQEPLNDSKPPTGDTKDKTTSSDSRKSPAGSQRSLQKSPYSSRKSSAKSARSNSQRSLRSRSESRASSAYSAKDVGKSNGDQSDSSLSNLEDGKPQLHIEGKDRPKSRLGHPGADSKNQSDSDKELDLPKGGKGDVIHLEGVDRPKSRLGHPDGQTTDKDSLHSSTLSIKSSTSSFSHDSGVENGRKEKKTIKSSDSNSISSLENRRNNQDQRRKNEQQSVLTKPNRKMGSRSSVSSKSSTKSETDNRKNGNHNKGNKSSEKVENKEKAEKEVKVEIPGKEAKIHKIPSTSFAEEGTVNDERTQYKTDDEKVKELENNKEISDLEMKSSVQAKENKEEVKNDDTVQPNNSENDTEVKAEVQSIVKEQEAEYETTEKQVESKENTTENNDNKADEKVEIKIESQETKAGEAQQNIDKSETDITENDDENTNIKEENDKTQGKLQEIQENIDETQGKGKEKEVSIHDTQGKITGSQKKEADDSTDTDKNKLNRQDSFDDEDEDRKVNKDLDKIEY